MKQEGREGRKKLPKQDNRERRQKYEARETGKAVDQTTGEGGKPREVMKQEEREGSEKEGATKTCCWTRSAVYFGG